MILAAPALDGLIPDGKVVAGSRVDLVRSTIGMVVRAGRAEARHLHRGGAEEDAARGEVDRLLGERERHLPLHRALPEAGHRGADQGARRSASRASAWARVVARGDAEIGFQQVSELLPIAGVDFVGAAARGGAARDGLLRGHRRERRSRPRRRASWSAIFRSAAAAPVIARPGWSRSGSEARYWMKRAKSSGRRAGLEGRLVDGAALVGVVVHEQAPRAALLARHGVELPVGGARGAFLRDHGEREDAALVRHVAARQALGEAKRHGEARAALLRAAKKARMSREYSSRFDTRLRPPSPRTKSARCSLR